MSVETKLDELKEMVGEIHTDLKVHIAEDAAVWKQVAKNEEEIKELARDAGNLKTKHAALVAAIATTLGSGLSVIGRLFLP